jgi:hypothetical protein
MDFDSFLIVVPTLDSYCLLPRLRDSLLLQSFTSWRVLFVNGVSSPQHNEWLEACCSLHTNFSYVNQDVHYAGIYGAMNQGVRYANNREYVMFWGSDDWCPNQHVLEKLFYAITCAESYLSSDFFICSARYFQSESLLPGRISKFTSTSFLSSRDFRSLLFWGASPPHQATIFKPSFLKKRGLFSQSFKLASDLDFFLNSASIADLRVAIFDLEVVNMLSSGVSGRMHNLRLHEVSTLYFNTFNLLFIVPFISRYIRRLISVILPPVPS